MKKLTGIDLIAQERKEQINVHKFSIATDNAYYVKGELKMAAMFAITQSKELYPASWDNWFLNKMEDKRQRMGPVEFDIERLKIAGALIAAEIDRLQQFKK